MIAGALLVGLGGWGGVHAWHSWQERHLVRRAAGYLSGGDVKTASLSARRAYQLNPDNPETARMLAQIAERSGDGSELEWRRKVVELAPGSIEDALALVRCALRGNDLNTAEKTLQNSEKIGQQTPGYFAARGRLAEIRKNPKEAEAFWRKATELAPEESAYQVQLAMVRLGSAEEAKRTAAGGVLENLRSDPKQRAAATRALIIDGAARRGEAQRLRDLTRELQDYPEAVFSDRVLYLEILRQMHDPALPEYLAKLEQEAAGKAPDAATLLSWLSAHDNSAEALRFASTLPEELSAKWPVPLAIAESYAKAGDWSGLQRKFAESTWRGFEFLRHAYLARALRGEQQQLPADQEWARAQKEAAAQPQALMLLTRTVFAWDWIDETNELLWTLSKSRETQKEALQLLYQHFAKRGDTPGVYRVLLHSAQIAPEDLTVQNNLAQVSLLLDADVERARKIAADLAQKEPTNAAYVSTYAFSLLAQGDTPGARKAMETLSPEQLQAPGIAVYYGIVLAAAGEREKARAFLQRGAQAYLLPEEKALLAKAEAAAR